MRARGGFELAVQGGGNDGAQGAWGQGMAEAPEGLDFFGRESEDFGNVKEGGEWFYAGWGGGDIGNSRAGGCVSCCRGWLGWWRWFEGGELRCRGLVVDSFKLVDVFDAESRF